MNKFSNPRQQMKGYLMVEVMVSMIIILIGIMGIAKLQHVAKSSNAQAVQRTLAVQLADNLIERIRINTAAIDTYFPTDTTVEITQGSRFEPAEKCASNCSESELATYDLWEWEQHLTGALETVGTNLTGGLVDPTACLLRPTGGGDGIYHIAIAWHGQSKLVKKNISANSINANNCGTAASDKKYDEKANNNAYWRIHWQTFYLDV